MAGGVGGRPRLKQTYVCKRGFLKGSERPELDASASNGYLGLNGGQLRV